MNRPGATTFRIVLLFLGGLASMGRVEAQEPGRSADRQAESLTPDRFDLLRRTLEGVHEELLAADPDLAADALRGRLLIEAYQLIDNVMRTGLPEDQLLLLPDPLKQEAGRLVSIVLDDPQPPEPSEPDRGPSPSALSSAPVRLRPFESILSETLADRFEQLKATNIDQANLRETLDREAIAMAARAVSPANDPRELLDVERAFILAMARRVASGDRPAADDAGPAADTLLQDELDGIAELIRRKNAEWKISGEWPGINDRVDQLEHFGVARLEETLGRRNPGGSPPRQAREQIRAMAELTARGIPVALPPETPTTSSPDGDGDGDGDPTDPDGEPSEPEEPAPVEPFELAPEQLQRLARLARAVDQGLIVAGIDLPTRRATLRKFFREHAARLSGRTVETLPRDFLDAVDDEVEQILAEHGPLIGPRQPPVIVQPPVVTVPPVITVPTSPRPTWVEVPDRSPRWCFPWN
ncbi:hypothetical protein AB1L88_01620 [Tautonia sp. JC769]|uniref:hypothetical protein n=1 Tax=Tautonia sp. JC769 TaxID=3232135 RepID=UPI003459236E